LEILEMLLSEAQDECLKQFYGFLIIRVFGFKD